MEEFKKVEINSYVKKLIEQGTVTLQDAICCRDDIMIYIIKKGVPPNPAFKIMETVRKGKALKDKDKWAEYVALMKEHDVPDWYIKSCEKIKYMFPKAHAAAYVTNAFRIAWFKVHKPEAYYAAYFTIRADEFDSEIMCFGEDKVKNKMKEIDLSRKLGNNKRQEYVCNIRASPRNVRTWNKVFANGLIQIPCNKIFS